MEQNPPVLAKKVWSLLRIMFFMLKKTISKTRFFTDLNMIIKRGKIAGKSLHNLLFHHHHHWAATTFHRHPHHLSFFTPPPTDDEFSCTTTPQHPYPIDDIITMVKQLRITDSPFPLNNGDEDGQVDEDAEKFIMRFYNGLKREN